jgi:hypothetical protein
MAMATIEDDKALTAVVRMETLLAGMFSVPAFVAVGAVLDLSWRHWIAMLFAFLLYLAGVFMYNELNHRLMMIQKQFKDLACERKAE